MPLFTTLHPLLQSSALHIIIVAEGDKQRVTVQPKPTGKGADVPPALSLLGTPEEFDAEFAAAVATWRAPTASLVAQAEALAAGAAQAAADDAKPDGKATTKPADATRSTAAKKAAETRKAKAEAEKKAREERAAKAAETRRLKAEKAAQEKADREAAAAAKRAAKAPRPKPDETNPPTAGANAQPGETNAPAGETNLQAADANVQPVNANSGAGETNAARATTNSTAVDRAACVHDMRAWLATLSAGTKPARAAYLASKPATGRRYERLFVSFDELVDAARQQDLLPAGDAQPAAGDPDVSPQALEATKTTEPAIVAGGPPDGLTPTPAPAAADADPAWVPLADVNLPGTTTPEQAANHPDGHRAQILAHQGAPRVPLHELANLTSAWPLPAARLCALGVFIPIAVKAEEIFGDAD